MEKQNLIMGLWKFSDRITIDELQQVAEEWAKEDEYTQLYIRKASKDQNGIGFTYDLKNEPNTKESMDEYTNKTSDILKRKFGNDLVGWDISNMVYIIKDKVSSDESPKRKATQYIPKNLKYPRH